MNLTIIDLAEAIASAVVIATVGITAARSLKTKDAPMPPAIDGNPTPPPPSAAERALDMVRGGILREYRLLKSPAARMEFLHLIRAECGYLYSQAREEQRQQDKQHPQNPQL